MKGILVFVFAVLTAGIVVMPGLSGCSPSEESYVQDFEQGKVERALADNELPSPATRVLKLAATLVPNASPIKCLERFGRTLYEKTGGELSVQIFPASRLGGQRDFVEGVSLGTVDMCLIANGALEFLEPRFSVYSLPFLFRDRDHVYRFYESRSNQEILDDFRTNKGIRTVGIFTEGEFRTVWTNMKPVRSLNDFTGVKLRVPDVPIYIDMFSALGADATPLPIGDVYSGLQTGIIEGLELSATSIILSKVTEVVNYNTLTNHIASPMLVLVNEEVYQSLTEKQRQIFDGAMQEASRQDRINADENERFNHVKLAALNIELISLPENELQKIREVMDRVIQKYAHGIIPPEMLTEIKSLRLF